GDLRGHGRVPPDGRDGDVWRPRLPRDAARADAARARRGAERGSALRALVLLRAGGPRRAERRGRLRGARARQLAPPRPEGQRRGGAPRPAPRPRPQGRHVALREPAADGRGNSLTLTPGTAAPSLRA